MVPEWCCSQVCLQLRAVLEETWRTAFSWGKGASPVAEVKSGWHSKAFMIILRPSFVARGRPSTVTAPAP